MTIRPVAIAALLLTLLASPTALATTAPRTFVASTGSDAHPCSLSEPCRSFATAIAKTAHEMPEALAGPKITISGGGIGKSAPKKGLPVVS